MRRRVAVLRPEPGNAETCARAQALGLDAIALPLFEIVALPWTPPDPANHDALLLTSANAARMAGAGLNDFASLALLAVGEKTAAAARAAGLAVAVTGDHNAESLLENAATRGYRSMLHLGGRETMIGVGGIVSRSIAVYASVARPFDATMQAALTGGIALLHSPRAAARIGILADQAGIERGGIALVALSPAVATAAGAGWAAILAAAVPTDAALLEATLTLAN